MTGPPAPPARRVPSEADFPGVDLDLLAYDLADLLDRCDYPIDVDSTHIRAALPAFLRQVTAIAAADDSDWEAGAMNSGEPWIGDGAPLVPDAALAQQRGRPPAMSYRPWSSDRGIELGAVTAGEWYWRCRACRVWAGPCDRPAAATAGTGHRQDAHDRAAAVRAEARIAARRVCKGMNAARLDDMTGRLAAAHGLTDGIVHTVICRTATAIGGPRSTCDEVLFNTGNDLGTAGDGDYGKTPHPRVVALVRAIAAELGHTGWLDESMAARARR